MESAGMITNINVLDHGYVKRVERWGSDESIVEAARMSTNKGFQGWGNSEHYEKCPDYGDRLPRFPKHCEHCGHCEGDEALLRYLYEHKHMTPFEMGGLIIEVQAPIFVFREWHRHRTQSYNELSARYTELPDIEYVPNDERLMMSKQSSSNKQSSEAATFTADERTKIREVIESTQQQARAAYRLLLAYGVSREVARVVVPVSQYSRMRASANLRNWLAFLTLRMDPAAQWEIREFANAVGTIIEQEFPRTWELFRESR